MTARASAPLAAVCALMLAGCWSSPGEFMREPALSPVGSGIVSSDIDGPIRASALDTTPTASLGPPPSRSLYSEPRVTKVGDIVRVLIAINDKATLGNSSGRSTSTKDNVAIDFGFTTNSSGSGTPTITADLASGTSAQGQGTIDRSEQIQVSVAAVVTRVMPNGNLEIAGSQEVRVNYELRDLTVAGIVRPSDIDRHNTVSYDRIAEARISYGGRGRSTDVQQPSWGQQIYDVVRPF